VRANAIKNIFANTEIILVAPQVPENVGLAARVMKNTGFYNLSLVDYPIVPKSLEVAKRGRGVLEQAKRFTSLKEALAGAQFVFGTTRRVREYKFVYDFNAVKPLLLAMASREKVAIVFGQENFGLSGADVEACHGLFYLPSSPELPSYNLALAVGIVCYELMNLSRSFEFSGSLKQAPVREIESLLDYAGQYLKTSLYSRRAATVLRSLRRILLRFPLTENEVALLKSLILLANPPKK